MPGVSIIADKNLIDQKFKIRKSLNTINFLPNFESDEFINNDMLYIGCNRYQEYPIKIFNYKNYFLIIEGKIYNKNEIEIVNEINKITDSFYVDSLEIKMKNWIMTVDGDFIIYIVNRDNNDLLIFNDVFGRLPLYYHCTETGIIISRYLRFITGIIKKYEIDTIGIAEFFLLGYMLGERTLFENINHLRPASYLSVRNFQIRNEVLHKFNFEYRKYSNRSFNENLESLLDLFSQASNYRFNNSKKNVVTLSGGLDSRLIASCMHKNKIPFEVATLTTMSRFSETEVEVAQKLSDLFNVNSKVFKLESPKGKDVYELIRVKEGMNSLATTQLLTFYRQVGEYYSKNINFITGDNGDKLIFTIDKPIKKCVSLEDLANYILNEHSIIDKEIVSSVLQIEKDTITNEIVKILQSFPEDSFVQKYIHFRTIEKPFKYAYQGEDRHRNYFWHLTPFWSVPFFDYIMNCSDESKRRHKLFGSMIKKFNPGAIKLPYTNFGSSVFSIKGKIAMNLLYHVYPKIPSEFRGIMKNKFFGGNRKMEQDSVLLNCIRDEIKNSKFISKYLILNEATLMKLRKLGLFNILTITSVIEDFYDENSTLKKYFEVEI